MINNDVSRKKRITTPLYKAKCLGLRLGFQDLYLKLEGKNQTGTHKDRAAFDIVRDAISNGHPGITAGTCGNLGVSLAYFCHLYELPCHIFIPDHYSGKRSHEIADFGSDITCVNGSYEKAVEESNKWASAHGYYDANPNNKGGSVAMRAFQQIAFEIIESLAGAPYSVWIPVGNGTTLSGIFQGFQMKGYCPRLGAVGSFGNTAAISSINAGTSVELPPGSITESEINEVLASYRSYHDNEAITAMKRAGGWVHEARDSELIEASELLFTCEGISTFPTSAAAIAGFKAADHEEVMRNAVHVILVTA